MLLNPNVDSGWYVAAYFGFCNPGMRQQQFAGGGQIDGKYINTRRQPGLIEYLLVCLLYTSDAADDAMNV